MYENYQLIFLYFCKIYLNPPDSVLTLSKIGKCDKKIEYLSRGTITFLLFFMLSKWLAVIIVNLISMKSLVIPLKVFHHPSELC